MSRIVPVYIDLESSKYAILASEINENLKVYKLSVETASDTWVLSHGENTESALVKVYVNGEEVVPQQVLINDALKITVTFNTPVAGDMHVFLFNLNTSIAPTPTVTPNPTSTPTPTLTPSITPSQAPIGLFGLHSIGITTLNDEYLDAAIDETNGITYACGSSQDAVAGDQPILSAFNSASGNIISTTTYATGFTGEFTGITKIGDFLYCAGSVVAGGNYNAVLVKFNTTGGVVWQRGFVSQLSLPLEFLSIVASNETGTDYIYACGSVGNNSGEGDKVDGTIVKFDTDGNRIWQQRNEDGTLSKSNLYSSIRSYDGQIVLAGGREQEFSPTIDGFSATVNQTNGLLFQSYKTINMSGESIVWNDLYADATDYYICGHSLTFNKGIITRINRTSSAHVWTKSVPAANFKSIVARNGGTELLVVGEVTDGNISGAILYIDPLNGDQTRSAHLMFHQDGGNKSVTYNSVFIDALDKVYVHGSANNTEELFEEAVFFAGENAAYLVNGVGISLPQYEIAKTLVSLIDEPSSSLSSGFTSFGNTDTVFTQATVNYLTDTITFFNSTTSFVGVAITPTPAATSTPIATPAVTPTVTATVTATPAVTPTVTATAGVTPTITPTVSNTPAVTITATATVTPTVTSTAAVTPTITPTLTMTPSPTNAVIPENGIQLFDGLGIDSDVMYGITATDTKIYACGDTNYNTDGRTGGSLYCLDKETGVEDWAIQYRASDALGGSSNRAAFYDVIKIDSFLYVTGFANKVAPTLDEYKGILCKFDLSGNLIWQRNISFGGSHYRTRYRAIVHINESGTDYLYTAGPSLRTISAGGYGRVTKWDLDGTAIWTTAVTGDRPINRIRSIEFENLIANPSGDGIIATGYRLRELNNERLAITCQIDASGALGQIRAFAYGGGTGRAIAADSTYDYIAGDSSVGQFVVKMDRATGAYAWAVTSGLTFDGGIYSITLINGGTELLLLGWMKTANNVQESAAINTISVATGLRTTTGMQLVNDLDVSRGGLIQNGFLDSNNTLWMAGQAKDTDNSDYRAMILQGPNYGNDLIGAVTSFNDIEAFREFTPYASNIPSTVSRAYKTSASAEGANPEYVVEPLVNSAVISSGFDPAPTPTPTPSITPTISGTPVVTPTVTPSATTP